MAIYNNNGQYGLFNLQDTPENVLNSGYGETYYGRSRAFDQADREQALRDVEYSKRDVEGNVIEPDFAEGYGAGTDRIDYDPAFGTLNSFRRFQPAPYTGQRPFANLVDLPSDLNYLSNSPPSLERILDKNKMFNRFELNSETPQMENNQYDVNDAALGIMENAFNQRQIMADETSIGNYPTESVQQTTSTPLNMDRFTGVSNLGRNDIDVEQVEQLGSPSRFQGLKNKIGSGLGSIKDFAMDKGRTGRNLLGSAGAMALGLPGIVGSGLMNILGNSFEDRQLTGDIEDEYGNMYSADELNSQNALGGYYTDPARSARRRTGRIAKMRARDFNDKKISQTNLDRLVRQEKAQQLRDAKDAADRANIQNVQNYTGRELSGYRMSRPASERNYTGGGPQANDPIGGFENKSGMGRTGYEEGGLASMFTRRR